MIKMMMVLLSAVISLQAYAQAEQLINVRWTIDDKMPATFSGIVPALATQLQISLAETDFKLKEEKSLQGLNFKNYVQLVAGVPVRGSGIRIWSDAVSGGLVQMMAKLQNPASNVLKFRMKSFSGKQFVDQFDFAKARALAGNQIKQIRNFKSEQVIYQQTPAVWLEIFGKDRMLTLVIRNSDSKIIYQKMRLYPRGDSQDRAGEYSIYGKAYTVNEEVEAPWGRKFSGADPQLVELKYLKETSRKTATNWKQYLAQTQFNETMMDDAKAQTAEGISAGYWSRASVQDMIANATKFISVADNMASTINPANFDGRYVTVLLHGNATAVTPFNFPVSYASYVSQSWAQVAGEWIMSIVPASFGKAFNTDNDLLTRPAVKQIAHDNAANLQAGFDEMQVYWTVTKWFEAMQAAGFNDIELSTRPVQAYLFDPEVEMQDNAYYNEDTINFTTYSERNGNEARNLVTVWHELGHGLMDRLQGSSGFSNGGLSEGIADFGAEMALRGVYLSNLHPAFAARRIVNSIGFGLTNEGHDDGEAYGGSLYDLMELAIAREGQAGYLKICDLILTAMRLTRSSSDLNIDEWYSAIVLSDRLGNAGLRAQKEFAKEIEQIFKQRNYFGDHAGTRVEISYLGTDVTEEALGSRYKPVRLKLNENESADMELEISIPEMAGNYKLPIVAEVHFERTNALQGAIRFKDENIQTLEFTTAGQVLKALVSPTGKCDYVNSSEGLCKDFANVQFFEKGHKEPFAKKRFYVEIVGKNP